MLLSFFGSDTIGVRQKAYEYIRTLEEGMSAVKMTPEEWTPGSIEDAAGGLSLWGGKQVYIIDTPSESKGLFEYVFASLPLLSESGNTFVIIESKLLAPEKKKLEKYSKECYEIKAAAEERFNTFSMADALLRKDKKTLWLLLTEARREGVSEEEIVGVLLWQLKMMRLAAKTNGASEAGVKDFPYNKAKRALKTVPPEEADRLSRELVSLYHDGHQGIRDIDIALEKFILSL